MYKSAAVDAAGVVGSALGVVGPIPAAVQIIAQDLAAGRSGRDVAKHVAGEADKVAEHLLGSLPGGSIAVGANEAIVQAASGVPLTDAAGKGLHKGAQYLPLADSVVEARKAMDAAHQGDYERAAQHGATAVRHAAHEIGMIAASFATPAHGAPPMTVAEEAAIEFDNMVRQADNFLRTNPDVVEKLGGSYYGKAVSPAQMAHGIRELSEGRPGFIRMLYGNALEAVVTALAEDRTARIPPGQLEAGDAGSFRQVSGANKIDFEGTGKYADFTAELTTEDGAAAHANRPYMHKPGSMIFTDPPFEVQDDPPRLRVQASEPEVRMRVAEPEVRVRVEEPDYIPAMPPPSSGAALRAIDLGDVDDPGDGYG